MSRTSECNRNGCLDEPTVTIVDTTTGTPREVMCLAHAVETAEGLAARDAYIDRHGKPVLTVQVVR